MSPEGPASDEGRSPTGKVKWIQDQLLWGRTCWASPSSDLPPDARSGLGSPVGHAWGHPWGTMCWGLEGSLLWVATPGSQVRGSLLGGGTGAREITKREKSVLPRPGVGGAEEARSQGGQHHSAISHSSWKWLWRDTLAEECQLDGFGRPLCWHMGCQCPARAGQTLTSFCGGLEGGFWQPRAELVVGKLWTGALKDGISAKYYGETTKSTYCRTLEHRTDITKMKPDNAMAKHCLLQHGGQVVNFKIKSVGNFRSAMWRQVNEAVRINMIGAQLILNSKAEWHQAPLYLSCANHWHADWSGSIQLSPGEGQLLLPPLIPTNPSRQRESRPGAW